ncbi:unnamed protein product [Musa acuminata subsp. malaccensis]|uniref:(wild Malaysian banana) hypothetical protein n=1 Tax=Musa acuminata subsp. malaccensis TaxID=214687 RepID=A0A804J7H4_MUSAM|nr:PREDICTED: uncharacterized protein LOC103985936 [Musa acuminata subsp. malaccensis]CAG1839306.1 unnamed protein product [Musa acuminata subsp. malaccensis]
MRASPLKRDGIEGDAVGRRVGRAVLHGGAAAVAGRALVRCFSRKHRSDTRRINPKVPREEATAISHSLYQIVKDHGPLSVSNTWNHAKHFLTSRNLWQCDVEESSINGSNSKTHMKIMLKWMMGRKMLKLSCTHVDSAKEVSPLYSAGRSSSSAPPSHTLNDSRQGEKSRHKVHQIGGGYEVCFMPQRKGYKLCSML